MRVLFLCFAGCSASVRAPVAPRALNTSIAAAIPLAVSASVEAEVPCGAALYFGPFAFETQPQKIAILSSHQSLRGEQACVGAEWVDQNGVFIESADGIGCPEGREATRMTLDYVYQPEAGNSPANPIYLKVRADDAYCARSSVALSRLQ